MKRKRLLAFAFAAFMCFSVLAGCSNEATSSDDEGSTATKESILDEINAGTSTEAVDTEDYDYSAYVNEDGKTVIRAAVSMDPTSFDSKISGNNVQTYICNNMRQALICINRTNGEIEYRLAKSYELDEDGVTYHVELFDYIYDSAGVHFTAYDAKYAIDVLKAAGVNNTANIQEVNVINDYNLDIVFDTPIVGVFETCLSTLFLFTQESYEAAGEDFSTEPVYTGRYVLKEYVPGNKVVLEKNEDFWQTDESYCGLMDQGNVDIIEFYIITDSVQLSLALETDQVDMVCGLSYVDAQLFINSDDYKTFTYPNTLIQCMLLNMDPSNVFCDNPKLREAVMYCMDVQGMMDASCDGLGEIVPIWGDTGSVDYVEDWNNGNGYYTYDLDYALQCMEEANVDTGSFSLRIMTNGDELRDKCALVLQANLEAIGIQSEILSYNDALFNTYKNDGTQWDIILDNMGFPYLTNMYRQKFLKATFADDQPNAIFWYDDTLQELIETALDISTNSDESVSAVQRYLFENNVARGLFKQTVIAATKDCVVEFSANSNSNYMSPFATKYVWNLEEE